MKTCRPAKRGVLLAVAGGLVLLGVGTGSRPADADGGWSTASADYSWSFPRDHWAHRDFALEWWYVTGHLEAQQDPSRRFGYQFTLFRIGLVREMPELDSEWRTSGLLMGHAAVTDIRRGEHRFSEVLSREMPLLAGCGDYPDELLAWTRAPAGSAGRWTLRWNGEAFDFTAGDAAREVGFSLSTRPRKAKIFHGPNGFSRKSAEANAASMYYSYTRLETRGTLTIGGETFRVTGESWMDKEFSTSQLAEQQVGWDWFSLQLDDGRELMLYELRDRDGAIDHARGTVVSPDGRARHLTGGEWTVRTTKRWRSPQSGIEYPAGWSIALPSAALDFSVEPEVADQENRSRIPGGPSYWEGAVRVLDGQGKALGKGYVELTGYGDDNRPPL